MKTQKILSLCLAVGLGIPAAVTVLTGCAGDRNSRSTGQYIDDKTLAMRVASAVHGSPVYKLNSVEVKAYRGVIQLSGFVDNKEQKKKAGEIAQSVEGVRNVENNLSIKPKPTAESR